MQKRKNFTLIELLITIAIIAILAAMLLPTLQKAQEKAQKVKCLNNLKQIGTGIYNYSVDYNGFAPLLKSNDYEGNWTKASYLSYNQYTGQDWQLGALARVLVEPEYVSIKILECPGARRSGVYANPAGGSMWYNTSLYKKPSNNHWIASSYLIRPTALKNVISLYSSDYANPSAWGYRLENPKFALAADFVGTSKSDAFSHTDGVNVAFEDGSAGWVPGLPRRLVANSVSYSSWWNYPYLLQAASRGYPADDNGFKSVWEQYRR